MIINRNTIIFLWSNPGSYLVSLLDEITRFKVNVILVYWDDISENQLITQINSDKFQIIKRSSLNSKKLLNILTNQCPSKIVISGWMDFEYLKAVYTYKKINKLTKTYCAIDDQWKNTLRQKITYSTTSKIDSCSFEILLINTARLKLKLNNATVKTEYLFKIDN